MSILSQLRPAVTLILLFTVITGLLYPLAVTGIAQLAFPVQANGSIVMVDGVAVGSEWIGQSFTDPAYFWPRPSATGPVPYNAAASGGSNLAPTSPELLAAVEARIAALRAVDPENDLPAPVDLVTASGSGLDPHITPAAAEYQLARVARARGLDPEAVAHPCAAAHGRATAWHLWRATRECANVKSGPRRVDFSRQSSRAG